jgi:hypothetical protein
MKLSLFFFFIFFVISHAKAMELNLGECQTTAQTYILQGSASDSYPGARLWNFKKFSKTFADHEGSQCERQTFNQALQETNEYWKHIEKKYNCPKEGVKQCESVASNLAYVDSMEKLYDGSKLGAEITVDKNCQTVIDHKTQNLSKDVFQIIGHIPAINGPVDECAHVPSKDRKGAYDNLSSTTVVSSAIGGCMINIIKGFFNNIKDLLMSLWDLMGMAVDLTKKYGGLIVDFLKAAWYGSTATFFAEQAAQGADFFKDLMKSFKAIPQALYNAAAGQVKDFQCMNAVARTEMICKAAGYLGPEILLAVFTGGTATAAKLAAKSTTALTLVKRTDKATDIARAAVKGGKIADKVIDTKKFRKVLNDLGHKIDFEVPTEYFNASKIYEKDDIIKYMKKIGATEDQISSPQKLKKWCVRKAAKVHPDVFAHLKNADIIKASEYEFKNFMNLCDFASQE